MAHSLEVRVPLVDAHLLRKLAPLLVTRRAQGKQILACAPRPAIPAPVRGRRKTGFTLPMKEWLGEEGAGKRAWTKRVYEEMFSSARGSW